MLSPEIMVEPSVRLGLKHHIPSKSNDLRGNRNAAHREINIRAVRAVLHCECDVVHLLRNRGNLSIQPLHCGCNAVQLNGNAGRQTFNFVFHFQTDFFRRFCDRGTGLCNLAVKGSGSLAFRFIFVPRFCASRRGNVP